MNEEYKTVHEFDFSFICDYFKLLERQGPGSPEVTRKALSFIENLPVDARMADLGCGTGTQTLELAINTTGHITALDLFPDFIEILDKRITERGLQNRMSTVVGTMAEPPFGEEELDLIWSEGAIYNIGFENGLRLWNKFLKPGGYVAVSEASWFTPTRPDEINNFWVEAYPEIDTIPNVIAKMERTGYIPVAHFILPTTCWTEHFYAPQPAAQEIYLASHAGNKLAEELVASQRYEESLYNKYKDYYGYVFYIGQKQYITND